MKPLLAICFLLLSYHSALSASGTSPVYLSHFYIAVDQVTYDALRKSPDIAALASVEERHTVAGSREWSGFYAYGRRTYMEFFVADTLPDGTIKEGSGLGLSVETAGGVEEVASRLRTVFSDKVEIDKQVRTIATGDIPWYVAAAVGTDGSEAMETWIMEVDQGCSTALDSGPTPTTGPRPLRVGL